MDIDVMQRQIASLVAFQEWATPLLRRLEASDPLPAPEPDPVDLAPVDPVDPAPVPEAA